MITDKEKKALKEAHGEIWELKAGDKAAYFKKPERPVIGLAMVERETKGRLGFTEVILMNSFVAGDQELLQNTGFVLGAIPHAFEMVDVELVEIKKL